MHIHFAGFVHILKLHAPGCCFKFGFLHITAICINVASLCRAFEAVALQLVQIDVLLGIIYNYIVKIWTVTTASYPIVCFDFSALAQQRALTDDVAIFAM